MPASTAPALSSQSFWIPIFKKSKLMLVAKTVLKNRPDQNVLSLISCKPVMTFARDLRFASCLSVCDCSTDCEGDIHHRESAEALHIRAWRVLHGTGFCRGPADGKSGRMTSPRVTLDKNCSHCIFVLSKLRAPNQRNTELCMLIFSLATLTFQSSSLFTHPEGWCP